MAEYESLVLGLEALIKLKAKNIAVCGDSELVIKQIEGSYQTKDARMRAYRNLVLEMLEKFQTYSLASKLETKTLLQTLLLFQPAYSSFLSTLLMVMKWRFAIDQSYQIIS